MVNPLKDISTIKLDSKIPIDSKKIDVEASIDNDLQFSKLESCVLVLSLLCVSLGVMILFSLVASTL